MTEIAYVAATASSTLMLDSEGICRRVVPSKRRAMSIDGLVGNAPAALDENAERCVGAQYVASIDPSEPGGLAKLPRLGVPMVFASVNEHGKIFLIRTGPLVRFDELGESGARTTTNGRAAPPGPPRRALYVPPPVPTPTPLTKPTSFGPPPAAYPSAPASYPPPPDTTPTGEPAARLTLPPPSSPPLHRVLTPLPPPPRALRAIPPAPNSSTLPTQVAPPPRAASSHAWLRKSPVATLNRRAR